MDAPSTLDIISQFGNTALVGKKRKRFDREIVIDPAKISLMMESVYTSPVVNTSIQYVVSHVISNGVKLEVNDESEKWVPNEMLQQWVNDEFTEFVEEAMMKAFQLGFFVWSLVPSKIIDGFARPVLLRDGSYTVKKVWKGDEVAFKVYRTQSTKGNVMSMGTAPSVTAEPARDAWVTPVGTWKPDDFGRLQSPVANALSDITHLNLLWKEFVSSARHFTKPVLMFDSVETHASKSISPYEDGIVTPGDISAINQAYDSNINKSAAAEQEFALFRANMKRFGFNIQYDPVAQNRRMTPDDELYQNQYNTPVGSKFARAVTPSAIPDFTRATDVLVSRIVDVIGVPPTLRFSHGSISSASAADMTIRDFNQRVKRVQSMFKKAFTLVLRRLFTATIVKRNQESLKNTVADVKTLLIGKARQELLGDTPDLKEGDADKSDLLFGGSMTPKRIDTRRLKFDLSSASKLFVEAFNRVGVTFEHSPLTTVDAIRRLYQDVVISAEEYGRNAMRIVGLPDHVMLDNAERLREIKRRKLETEAAVPKPPPAPPSQQAPPLPSQPGKGRELYGQKALNPTRSNITKT